MYLLYTNTNLNKEKNILKQNIIAFVSLYFFLKIPTEHPLPTDVLYLRKIEEVRLIK